MSNGPIAVLVSLSWTPALIGFFIDSPEYGLLGSMMLLGVIMVGIANEVNDD